MSHDNERRIIAAFPTRHGLYTKANRRRYQSNLNYSQAVPTEKSRESIPRSKFQPGVATLCLPCINTLSKRGNVNDAFKRILKPQSAKSAAAWKIRNDSQIRLRDFFPVKKPLAGNSNKSLEASFRNFNLPLDPRSSASRSDIRAPPFSSM